MSTTGPRIFRITAEVANLEDATAFYSTLLGLPGQRHPGSRHYFNCGGVILEILDVTSGGMKPTPGPKSIYFAVDDLAGVHARAKELDALAPFDVHGQPAGDMIERPWGERSFYVTDPWGNELCFVVDGTLYT
ncbi:VOC family protein [Planosporangium thailandense]|uniref:VOC family protein n=1 Tax=Planosporangium thailandense TaxID=765197 RepID=A0ABX0Y231_9ACTN|nr:VOC family protein [Planosporangium thailandense]